MFYMSAHVLRLLLPDSAPVQSNTIRTLSDVIMIINTWIFCEVWQEQVVASWAWGCVN